MKSGEKLLTLTQVSLRLGISISSVYRLRDYGDIEVVKMGPSKSYRVRESALNEYIKTRSDVFW